MEDGRPARGEILAGHVPPQLPHRGALSHDEPPLPVLLLHSAGFLLVHSGEYITWTCDGATMARRLCILIILYKEN